MNIHKVYYHHLSSRHRAVYETLERGFLAFEPEIAVTRVERSAIGDILNAVLLDNPLLFSFRDITFHTSGPRTDIFPQYLYSAREVAEISRLCKAAVSKISARFPTGGDWEKELYIHDCLCQNVTYKEVGHTAHSIVGPLTGKTGVCEGIAKTAKLLFDKAQIDCCVVMGNVKARDQAALTEKHMWNKVKIDGIWYNLDITFDATVGDGESKRYDYFNLSDEEIKIDHAQSLDAGIRCPESARGYYETNGLVMHNQQKFASFLKKSIANRIFDVTVKLPSAADAETAHAKVMQNVQKVLDEMKQPYRNVQVFYNSDQRIFNVKIIKNENGS
ncbi:hypothetical protein FACS1894211_09560 [Clostridia bacterium]|nr:hypothetical protein FACS1894211_09560 [Clostridia bacterium]